VPRRGTFHRYSGFPYGGFLPVVGGGPQSTKQYVKFARECMRWAEESSSEHDRQHFLEMAKRGCVRLPIRVVWATPQVQLSYAGQAAEELKSILKIIGERNRRTHVLRPGHCAARDSHMPSARYYERQARILLHWARATRDRRVHAA
jgi:hypothetical protein